MRTDATIRWPDQVRIVECKYTKSVYVLSQHKRMLNPAYLRQVYAYAMAYRDGRIRRAPNPQRRRRRVDAVLLHAQPIGEPVEHELDLGGVPTLVVTCPLSESWPVLESRLSAVLGGRRPSGRAQRSVTGEVEAS